MFIHYFQDNQSTLEVSLILLIQMEEFKASCLPNSSCMWPLAVKTEIKDKGKKKSSTGNQIVAEPRTDGEE